MTPTPARLTPEDVARIEARAWYVTDDEVAALCREVRELTRERDEARVNLEASEKLLSIVSQAGSDIEDELREARREHAEEMRQFERDARAELREAVAYDRMDRDEDGRGW